MLPRVYSMYQIDQGRYYLSSSFEFCRNSNSSTLEFLSSSFELWRNSNSSILEFLLGSSGTRNSLKNGVGVPLKLELELGRTPKKVPTMPSDAPDFHDITDLPQIFMTSCSCSWFTLHHVPVPDLHYIMFLSLSIIDITD